MVRLALLITLFFSPAARADESLYRLIHERLSWMKEVAAWKFQRELPIENLEREAFVIEQATRAGLTRGITTESASKFFSAQIEAAKTIQSCWYQRWEATGEVPDAADLNTVIRPELIRLGDQIAERLLTNIKNSSQYHEIVELDCLPRENANNIFEALNSIEQYPDQLSQVTQSGILRVGTTGDYAPFSFSKDGKSFVGIDIDLANSLADHLGVELLFVQTSWPSLMQDLENGYYDVAMSGVSKIPAREEKAFFSNAYHIGGKTPIARCEEAERFATLEDIDQAGVKLIVNPGGTNERFIRANIRSAEVVMFDDNRDIFREIVKGNADLMVTDSIEVRLQSSKEPSLCPTMPGKTLTYQEKAYMMSKDEAFRTVTNEWLENARASGSLAQTFEEHLK